MSNLLGDITNTVTGGILGNDFSNAALIPAIGSAINEFNTADRYAQAGQQAADRADPFGQYRRGYGDQLQALYADPSKIAQTPGYKFTMDQALDATQARLAGQGFLGSSQMQQALAAQAGGIASQTWNTEADRLARLAGAQFDPANAARMQMEGTRQEMEARSRALGDLFYPFGPGANGPSTTINNNNTSSGGQGGGGQGGYGGTAGDVLDRMARNSGPGGIIPSAGTVANLWNRFLTDPGSMSPGDINLLENLGFDTGVDTGGMDYAPGGYDTSGWGGYGVVDPSTGSILDNTGVFDPNWGVGNYDAIFSSGGDYMPYDLGSTGFGTDFSGGDFSLGDLFGG